MAQLPDGNFDASQYGDMRDFSPVPPGKYVISATSSEMKDTVAGGQMLVINFNIIAGPYTGKGFVTRLNLVNANPTAVKIANEELATLTRAANFTQLTDSDQLNGVAMIATLKLVPGDGKYGPSNEPTGYASSQGLTEPPVNPDPDEATLAIMAGLVPGGAPIEATQTSAEVPAAPAGFAPPQVEQPAQPAPVAQIQQPTPVAQPAPPQTQTPAPAPTAVPPPPPPPPAPVAPAVTPPVTPPATQGGAKPPW